MSIIMRLLTYNILQGGMGRKAELLKVIRDCRPDLIILQELNNPEWLEILAAELDMQCYFAQANTQIISQGRRIIVGKRNIGLLSRYPLSRTGSYRPFPLRRTLLEAVVEYTPGKKLVLYGIHLKAGQGLLAEAWRRGEIKTILKRIAANSTREMPAPCLLAGDFNTVGPQDRVHTAKFPPGMKIFLALRLGKIYRWTIPVLLRSGFIDVYRLVHPQEEGYTLPVPSPTIRLDYIFISPDLLKSVRSCDIVKIPPEVHRASDHYPVLVELELE